MARIDKHSQHEGDRSNDEIGPEAGSGRGRPREPESPQESQGMRVGDRELRAQQRAAQIALSKVFQSWEAEEVSPRAGSAI